MLSIILGPMFSGKTTKLLNTVQYCKKNNLSYLVVNHTFDNRYNYNKITNHNQICEESLMLNTLSELEMKNIKNIDYLLIDEGQFFKDLEESVKNIIKNNPELNITIVGLDGDFQQNVFNNGQLLKLIPFAEKVVKIHSKCYICNQKAYFTKRITESKEQILISANENYKASCKKCLKL
jgi:thymidine kinase